MSLRAQWSLTKLVFKCSRLWHLSYLISDSTVHSRRHIYVSSAVNCDDFAETCPVSLLPGRQEGTHFAVVALWAYRFPRKFLERLFLKIGEPVCILHWPFVWDTWTWGETDLSRPQTEHICLIIVQNVHTACTIYSENTCKIIFFF